MKTYIYQAALYCEDCANNIIASLHWSKRESSDSDDSPQGPFPDGGGESDCPQHCDCCGTFLENPLTPDGDDWLREQAARYENGPTCPYPKQTSDDGPIVDLPEMSWSEIANAAENDGKPVLAAWIRYYYAPGM